MATNSLMTSVPNIGKINSSKFLRSQYFKSSIEINNDMASKVSFKLTNSFLMSHFCKQDRLILASAFHCMSQEKLQKRLKMNTNVMATNFLMMNVRNTGKINASNFLRRWYFESSIEIKNDLAFKSYVIFKLNNSFIISYFCQQDQPSTICHRRSFKSEQSKKWKVSRRLKMT